MRTIATIFAFLLLLAPGLVHAQTVTVNSTGDEAQGEGDVDCTDDGEECTLRAAIEVANNGDADVIEFDLGAEGDAPFTIQPETQLPAISDAALPLHIDGTTQDGHTDEQKPVVVDGSQCDDDPNCSAFRVDATGTSTQNSVEIEGLTINNWDRHAVYARGIDSDAIGDEDDESAYVFITSNFIGTDWTGMEGAPNGVLGQGESRSAVRLSGDHAIVVRNLISGNVTNGIRLDEDSNDNTVQENRIGVTIEGDALGNGRRGIRIAQGASRNFLFDNYIAYNGEGALVDEQGNPDPADQTYSGISVEAPALQNRFSQNVVYANALEQIFLESGANNDMPAPEIIFAEYVEEDDEIVVEYSVDADPGDFAYPLSIEFFLDEDDNRWAEAYLGDDHYSVQNARQNQRIRIFAPDAPNTDRDDWIVATATDDEGNTSELTEDPQRLPVEFADIPQATHDDGAVILNWATLSETNNAGFQVQQRVNGSFEDIEDAFVDGQGTTNSLQSYEYTLEGLAPGTHTLRLEQQDFDGTTDYSAEFSVSVPTQLQLTEAAPNPFADRTSITLSVDEGQQVSATVYDVLGRQVTRLFDGQVLPDQPQELTFEANGLSSGLYLIQIEGETFSEVRRVTIVR